MNIIRTAYLRQKTPRNFKFRRCNARRRQQGVECICFDGGSTGKQAEILRVSCGGSCRQLRITHLVKEIHSCIQRWYLLLYSRKPAILSNPETIKRQPTIMQLRCSIYHSRRKYFEKASRKLSTNTLTNISPSRATVQKPRSRPKDPPERKKEMIRRRSNCSQLIHFEGIPIPSQLIASYNIRSN